MPKTVEMVKSQFDENIPRVPKQAMFKTRLSAIGVLLRWERRDDLWFISRYIPLIKKRALEAKRSTGKRSKPPSNG